MKNKERVFLFVEPHYTGGHSIIEISEKQIVKHMKKKYPEISDKEAVEEFIALHFAWEKEDDNNEEVR